MSERHRKLSRRCTKSYPANLSETHSVAHIDSLSTREPAWISLYTLYTSPSSAQLSDLLHCPGQPKNQALEQRGRDQSVSNSPLAWASTCGPITDPVVVNGFGRIVKKGIRGAGMHAVSQLRAVAAIFVVVEAVALPIKVELRTAADARDPEKLQVVLDLSFICGQPIGSMAFGSHPSVDVVLARRNGAGLVSLAVEEVKAGEGRRRKRGEGDEMKDGAHDDGQGAG